MWVTFWGVGAYLQVAYLHSAGYTTWAILLIFSPPIILLILGSALGWAIMGFFKSHTPPSNAMDHDVLVKKET